MQSCIERVENKYLLDLLQNIVYNESIRDWMMLQEEVRCILTNTGLF